MQNIYSEVFKIASSAVTIIVLSNPKSDVGYIDDLMALNNRAHQSHSAPYSLAQDREFYYNNLAGATFNVLAMADQQVVGYTALRRMTPWPEYLDPAPANLPTEQCALLLYTLVDPHWRGKGIGKTLNQARLDIASTQGLDYLFSTVHPDNTPSMKNLVSLGFEVIAQKMMFSHPVLRNVLFLNLHDRIKSRPDSQAKKKLQTEYNHEPRFLYALASASYDDAQHNTE